MGSNYDPFLPQWMPTLFERHKPWLFFEFKASFQLLSEMVRLYEPMEGLLPSPYAEDGCFETPRPHTIPNPESASSAMGKSAGPGQQTGSKSPEDFCPASFTSNPKPGQDGPIVLRGPTDCLRTQG
jgi:hypothetical protein